MPRGVRGTHFCPVVEHGEVCGLPANTGGMCKKHATRFRRHGDPLYVKLIHGDDERRFLIKVDKAGPLAKNHPELGPCWLWTAYRNPVDGRGRFGVGDDNVMLAHRWAYEHWVGPIPEDKELDHFACDNGAGGCVNPAHVRPVSAWENTLRSNSPASIYRARTHCNRGHEYTPENTRIGSEGERHCRQCRLDYRRTGLRPHLYDRANTAPSKEGGHR